MTKIFFDTEFTGLQLNTSLISIGLVTEHGFSFYAELNDYKKELLDTMGCKDDVLNSLQFKDSHNVSINENYSRHVTMKGDSHSVAIELSKWLQQFGDVTMVADVLTWDWILFCELFGGAFKIPQNVHYIPIDISTIFDLKLNNSDINRVEFSGLDFSNHNALNDAYITKACYEILKTI